MRQKSAGYRTHVLVGLGACGFTLVSAYGFGEVLGADVTLDPSRIAAQIVSGIGFLGAGVIFKAGSAVRGLTTAATVWEAAAVGMACGAGMISLGVALTVLHLLTLFVFAPLLRHLPSADRNRVIKITYIDGGGVLRDALARATSMGYSASVLSSHRSSVADVPAVRVTVRFHGRQPLTDLVPSLGGLEGVESVELVGAARGGDDDTV
ncbi:MgtC/SapB family protein [Microbacterium sp. KUDC0406]|uniref:MgtC/SapB family protein n=1 Tax=Microbacterium sp. KUDC0406 TaxID=2909588 RepID=UPI001F3555A3|nr:MgtC/SapB family protein [Microbacterium sp. KUDC0406]UJP09595.1 MgtC/SapB family protein [Microbacterium sp. KUDC0406]